MSSTNTQILIATHNPSKKKELQHIFAALLPTTITFVTLADIGIHDDIEETGSTFEANAILKARHYAQVSKLPTIADDGGICIDALGGEPGVHSKRWMGREASDRELIDYCLMKMKHVPNHQRTAAFRVVLAFCDPQQQDVDGQLMTYLATGQTTGHIAQKAHTKVLPGFPYRALLIVDPYNKYYDELTAAEHAQVNHRVDAASHLADDILAWYNKHQ